MATIADPPTAVATAPEPKGGDVVHRHRLATRLWHWINAAALLVMLMSGLMIFNAHPRLYWGEYGANYDRAWLEIGARGEAGYLRVGTAEVATSGVLGSWTDQDGNRQRRAFAYWSTIPSRYSLADARLWHLAFAWVVAVGLLVFMIASLVNRHFRHDLTIRKAEIAPGHLWADVRAHARLRFPTGAAALRYNVLQKLAYASVIFVMLPLIILTGLTMSPATTSGWGAVLLDLFGGRQSARSIHFLLTWALVGFFIVHIVMVVLAGPINEVRSMISGRYRLPPDRPVRDDRAD